MKNKLLKILGIVMTISMLASFMVAGPAVSAAGSATPAVINEWENLTLPTTVPNSDVVILEQAEDGTIYAVIANYFPGVYTVTGVNYTVTETSPVSNKAAVSATLSGTWTGSTATSIPVSISGHDGTTTFYLTGTLNGNTGALTLTGTVQDDNVSATITSFGNTITGGTLTFGEGYITLAGLVITGVGTINGTFDLFQSNSLVKSTDGYVWKDTCLKNYTKEITAVEASYNYSTDNTVYVAVDTASLGHTTIYRCTNAADPATPYGILGQISAGDSGTKDAIYVYDLDSYYDTVNGKLWLLAATNIDVFAVPDDHGLTTVWTDMELSQTLGGAYSDVGPNGGVVCYKAMFSPDFGSSGVIWAVYFDDLLAGPAFDTPYESNTDGFGIIARDSGATEWGTVITPFVIKDGAGRDAKSACDLEFAADYSSREADGDVNLYAALSFVGDTNADDVYSIECNFHGAAGSFTPFDVTGTTPVDFCSLEVSGSLLVASSFDNDAATSDNTQVWVSLNDGITWNMASKNPTGELDYITPLLISTSGSTAGSIFIGTGGEQSAISISEDDGDTWNQISYIDDDIAAIVDIAFNPTNKTALLITRDADWNDSLWKTTDVNLAKPQWQRTLCENYSTDINLHLVEYAMDGTVVMVYDNFTDEIYRSSNNAQTFTYWKSTVSWGHINDWVIYDSTSVYAACDNGFWSTAVVGSDLTTATLVSIALQSGFDPDDEDNAVLVVGDDSGNAYISYDAGDNLEAAVPTGAGATNVYVAFDSKNVLYFAAGNSTYTAAIGATNFTMTPGTGDIDGASPLGGGETLVDIAVSADDTLYVLDDDGDMARWLLYDVPFTAWDIAENNATSTDELWITKGSNVAWTIDDASPDSIWVLDDTLSGKVTGVVVSDIGPFSAKISWSPMTGAEDYEIIFLYDSDDDGALDDVYFLPIYVTGTSLDTSDYIPVIPFLADATSYLVLVRVDNGPVLLDADGALSVSSEVELSRWSDAKAFTTKYYMDTPTPVNPGQGYNQASIHPSFGWSAVPNTKTYKFQLSKDPTFATLLDEVSVTTTAYTYAGDKLTYDSDYYWRVQAVGPDGTVSKWSSYTENYFSVTLEEFMAGWDVDDVFGFFRDGNLVFYWRSGAISNFHTMVDPAAYQSDLTVILPDVTTTSTTIVVTADIPDITIDPPTITATVNIPTQQTTITSINLVVPDDQTPVYIWAIVAIGALLTIAVIVLIIRTRRVV